MEKCIQQVGKSVAALEKIERLTPQQNHRFKQGYGPHRKGDSIQLTQMTGRSRNLKQSLFL